MRKKFMNFFDLMQSM